MQKPIRAPKLIVISSPLCHIKRYSHIMIVCHRAILRPAYLPLLYLLLILSFYVKRMHHFKDKKLIKLSKLIFAQKIRFR